MAWTRKGGRRCPRDLGYDGGMVVTHVVLPIICFIVGALTLSIGLVTEYRQSRRVGSYAIVPTLPNAVAAALFITFGIWFLPYAIPWWVFPLAFAAMVFVFGLAIVRATRRRSERVE
jgi:hypothetical protein